MYNFDCKKFDIVYGSRGTATRGEKLRALQAAESKERQMGDKIDILHNKGQFSALKKF
jgi:hypothetical protein